MNLPEATRLPPPLQFGLAAMRAAHTREKKKKKKKKKGRKKHGISRPCDASLHLGAGLQDQYLRDCGGDSI